MAHYDIDEIAAMPHAQFMAEIWLPRVYLMAARKQIEALAAGQDAEPPVDAVIAPMKADAQAKAQQRPAQQATPAGDQMSIKSQAAPADAKAGFRLIGEDGRALNCALHNLKHAMADVEHPHA